MTKTVIRSALDSRESLLRGLFFRAPAGGGTTGGASDVAIASPLLGCGGSMPPDRGHRRRRARTARHSAPDAVASTSCRDFHPRQTKIDFFWFSMLEVSPSMSFGFLMKSCSAGIITVDAKSGRVSRSRNCAMFFVAPMISADFVWTEL